MNAAVFVSKQADQMGRFVTLIAAVSVTSCHIPGRRAWGAGVGLPPIALHVGGLSLFRADENSIWWCPAFYIDAMSTVNMKICIRLQFHIAYNSEGSQVCS
jgi:hypothetical protein